MTGEEKYFKLLEEKLEKRKEASKKYYQKYKQELKEYKDKLEKRKEASKKYYQKHKQERKEYKDKYYKNNKDKCIKRYIKYSKQKNGESRLYATNHRKNWTTEEECIIMKMLEEGKTYQEIAFTLGRTLSSVKFRITKIRRNK